MSKKLRKMAKRIRDLGEAVSYHGDRLCDLEDAECQEPGGEWMAPVVGGTMPAAPSDAPDDRLENARMNAERAQAETEDALARIADLERQLAKERDRHDDALARYGDALCENETLRALSEAVLAIATGAGWRKGHRRDGGNHYFTGEEGIAVADALDGVAKARGK